MAEMIGYLAAMNELTGRIGYFANLVSHIANSATKVTIHSSKAAILADQIVDLLINLSILLIK